MRSKAFAGRQLATTSLLALAAVALMSRAANAQAALAIASDAPMTANAAKIDPESADVDDMVAPLQVVAQSGAGNATPAKTPLNATEPVSIIDRKTIDQFVPVTADYTQIAILSPSASGVASNGPGLSEAKTTLRGFKDGEYNITYDGIPWGDANGPTHHSTSFFPSSTIGGVEVDRGPGTAGQLGQATFGGSINLFSPVVSDVAGGSQALTYGSWNTRQSVTKLNTGDIDKLNGAHILVNLQELRTDGALSNSGASATNQLVRGVFPLSGSWALTVLGTWNNTKVHTADNPGATLAQVALYGKGFGLSNDPASPSYFGYNVVKKHTYFHYAKLTGNLTDQLSLEDTAYKYYYKNDTESALDTTLTPAEIAARTGLQITTTPGGSPTVNGHVPGYTKLNIYKIYGDVLRMAYETPIGTVRGGVWLEHADTGPRARYDYDATAGRIPDYRQAVKAGVPQNVEYEQFSGWDQYSPFLDFEWRPTDRLTITPGIKYVHFDLSVDAQINQKSRDPFHSGRSFAKTLQYLTANYRVLDNLAVYGQYATGFLMPDISITQVVGPDLSQIKPQTSTNYQAGFVWHGEYLAVDADVYKIDFKNKLQTQVVSGVTQEFNIGGATYQGVEGQITVSPFKALSVFVNGSVNEAKTEGVNNVRGVTVIGDRQIAKAPGSTAAWGLITHVGSWTTSVLTKVTGEQWALEGEPAAYRIPAYSQTDVTVAYAPDRYRFELALYNLFDDQRVTSITQNKSNSKDQYFFQPGRNFQFTAKVNF